MPDTGVSTLCVGRPERGGVRKLTEPQVQLFTKQKRLTVYAFLQ